MTKRDYLEHVVGRLDAARARLMAAEESPTAPEQHLRERYKGLLHEHGHTLTEAARALLAVMEPASDEEVRKNAAGYQIPLGEQDEFRAGYRTAEARARKLANWTTE